MHAVHALIVSRRNESFSSGSIWHRSLCDKVGAPTTSAVSVPHPPTHPDQARIGLTRPDKARVD